MGNSARKSAGVRTAVSVVIMHRPALQTSGLASSTGQWAAIGPLSVSTVRTRHSSGKNLWLIRRLSTSTGVPLVPTDWWPMIRVAIL